MGNVRMVVAGCLLLICILHLGHGFVASGPSTFFNSAHLHASLANPGFAAVAPSHRNCAAGPRAALLIVAASTAAALLGLRNRSSLARQHRFSHELGNNTSRTAKVACHATGHALIMQNKGGGHGEIGYHLCKALEAKGLKVTMLQDSAAKKNKVPYSLYDDDLKDANIVWLDPGNMSDYADMALAAVKDGPPVTHIFDNYSKNPDQIAPLISIAKASSDFKLYSFVSSAGMYTAKGELKEDMTIKDPPTGQREVEMTLDQELPKKWASFRPQYIYGPYTNKRGYLDWFLERASRGLPLPIPGDGSQPVNLAHCDDVALLLSSVVGSEEAAGGECFNCGTSMQVTYRALCDAAGKAVGKAAEVVSLPPGTKTSFPFRPNAEGFYVNVDKAKSKLGWAGPKHNVMDDIASDGFYTKDYIALGLDKGDIDTSKDTPA